MLEITLLTMHFYFVFIDIIILVVVSKDLNRNIHLILKDYRISIDVMCMFLEFNDGK